MPAEAVNVRDVFDRALEINTEAERAAYLDKACADSPEIRQEVEALLQAHSEAGTFLQSPAVCLTKANHAPAPSEIVGTQIGPYKLLQQIGEGGMGIVYLAQQERPIQRAVALKIIKPGMDSAQVIVRFEAERQALAVMDHPNIAKVLDAGTTDSARPYFVMELVKGIPITQYADEHRLTPRQRLEVFIPICQAVQHAHQKGIIHRDLKPTNVLVADCDDRAIPKVIDFGVAKAIGPQLTEKTMFTQFGQVVGTIEYMSPEQAKLSQVDIDTRTDIYSLGVLLYELLAGETPFDRQRLRSAAFDEMLRIIREEEPPKPSTRLSTTEALPAIAASRNSEPAKLRKLVRGELDWIVMRALEKDRNRRYDSANAFAADLQHYLHNEPVEACPPSIGYRLKKSWQRNRGLVSAAAVVFLCLIGGIIGTSWGLTQAVHAQSEARDEADAARRAHRAEELQHQLAEKEKARAEENLKQARLAVDKLFTRVAVDLTNKPHMEEIRRAMLVDALQFYQGFLSQKAADPELRHETARAYSRVGGIQEMLGRNPEAEAAWRQAVALLEKLADEFPGVPVYREDLAEYRASLAWRLIYANKHEENAELRRQVLVDYQKLAADFPTVPSYQRRVASAHTDLGNALKDSLGRLTEAEQHYRQALVTWKKLETDFPNEPVDHYGVSHSRLWLGVLLVRTGRLVEAAPELEQAVAIRERLVAQSPDDAGLKKNLAHAQAYLANLLRRTGKPHQAVEILQRAVALREKLQDDFPRDAENQRRLVLEYGNLGHALLDLGRTEEAEDAFRRALALARKMDADHPGVPPYPYELASRYYNLGLFLYDTNRPEEAADDFRHAHGLFETTAVKFPEDAQSQDGLAWFLATCPAPQFRDASRAVGAAKQALQRNSSSVRAWQALGIAQYRAGAWQAAEEALKKAIDLTHGGDPEDWYFLAMAHWQLGQKEEARKWYNKGVQWMKDHHSNDRELQRFQDEASKSLKIGDQQRANVKPTGQVDPKQSKPQ